MKKFSFATLVVLALLSVSCATQKKLAYFNDIEKIGSDSINLDYRPATEPLIKKGDKLLITVSALDPMAAYPYNMLSYQSDKLNDDQSYSTARWQYYIVDDEGNINFPMLGKLQVEGLTRKGLKELLEEKISASVNDPRVSVNYLNYGITVLGEVKNPGKYVPASERVSVLDALALAGDLTIYGKRDNVLLTREVNGKLEFVRLNLNSADLFRSPYFYLQQNDVLYVEPNNARALSSENLSLYFSMATTLASVTAVIVSVVNASSK